VSAAVERPERAPKFGGAALRHWRTVNRIATNHE
jgi:hypothetical protein